MDTKEQAKRKCAKCRYYEGYYYKGYCQFYRTDWGYCSEHEKSVRRCENCELWTSRYINRRITTPKVLQAMTKALTDISVLQQIFIEERQDK